MKEDATNARRETRALSGRITGVGRDEGKVRMRLKDGSGYVWLDPRKSRVAAISRLAQTVYDVCKEAGYHGLARLVVEDVKGPDAERRVIEHARTAMHALDYAKSVANTSLTEQFLRERRAEKAAVAAADRALADRIAEVDVTLPRGGTHTRVDALLRPVDDGPTRVEPVADESETWRLPIYEDETTQWRTA
jgi:hypothetical protein